MCVQSLCFGSDAWFLKERDRKGRTVRMKFSCFVLRVKSRDGLQSGGSGRRLKPTVVKNYQVNRRRIQEAYIRTYAVRGATYVGKPSSRWRVIVQYVCNKNQQNALFTLMF